MKTSRFHKSFGLIQAVVIIASMLAALVCAQPAAAQAGVPAFRPETLAYASFQEDAGNNGQVIADDSDGPALTYSVVTQPAHGYLLSFTAATGAFTYRADGDYNGADTFRVRVTDGTHPVEADVSITVQPVEDAPVANDDGAYTVSTPTYNWVSATGGTNLTTNLPTGDFNGIVSWNYSTNKETSVSIGFLMPFFNGLYDRVRIYSNGSIEFYNSTGYYTVNYNGLYQHDPTRRTAVIGMGGTKYVNKSTTTVHYTSSSSQFVVQFTNLLDSQVPNAPSTFEIILNSNGNILLQYQTVAGFVDGVGLGSPYLHPRNSALNYIPGVYLNRAQLNRAANAAFLFTPVTTYSTPRDTTLNATLAVGGNDFDPDGAVTGARSVVASPRHGTVTLNADGTFTYTPTAGYTGRDRFTYRVTQTDGRFMEADAHIYVTYTSASAGVVTTTTLNTWSAGCGTGVIEGWDPQARPFRFRITPPMLPPPLNQPYSSYGGMWFFPDTGEFSICTASTTANETWKGAITTTAGTTSDVNLTVGIPTSNSGLGTGTSGDGLYGLTPTQYTSGTQPWDELSSDPQAYDLTTELQPTSDNKEDNFDEHEWTVPLGFNFPYFNSTVSTVYPNTNGFMGFRANSALFNTGHQPLPRNTFLSGVHMLTQDGLVNSAQFRSSMPRTHVYTRTFYEGETPNRFVIEYFNLAVYDQETNKSTRVSTFEVVLYPDGRIETRYRTLDADQLVVGIQYDPTYGQDDGDLPTFYGLNYPYYSLANYLTLAYAPGTAYQANAGSPLTVSAPGVRANDFSVVSGGTDTPTLSVAIPPAHGAVTLNNDGSFTYTPSPSYSGRDYFAYTALFNSLPSTNVVAIDVINATPQPPVINSITGSLTLSSLNTATLNINATDANGDALDYSYTLAGGGTLAGATIDQTTGVFTWPNAAAGVYEITFRAFQENDAAQYDEETVTLTVSENALPVISGISGATTIDEGQSFSIVVSASDADNDPLTYSISANDTGGTFNPTTRTFAWTTVEANNGTYHITLRAAETARAGRYDEETYTLTVNEVNQAPIISGVTGAATVNEGAAVNLTVNATDADLPANTLTYAVTGLPTGAAFDTSTGILTWASAVAGSYPMTFTVTDNGTPALNDTYDLTLVVNHTNQPPVLGAITGSLTADEGSTLSFTVNATDLESDPLTYRMTANDSGGTFNPSTRAFTWATTEANNGTYHVTIRVEETSTPSRYDEETYTLTVNEINQAPVISGVTGPSVVSVGASVTLTVNAADADLPANTLTYAVTGLPAGAAFDTSTGILTWASAAAGSYPMTFTVTDNGTPALNDTYDFTLVVNRAPVFDDPTGLLTADEGSTLSFTVNAHDPEGDAITYSMTANDSGGTFNPSTRIYSWATTEANNGTYHVTIRAAETSTPARYTEITYTLTVNEVPMLPVISGLTGATTINEGQSFNLTVNASDPDGDPISLSIISGPAGASFDPTTGVFTWTPGEVSTSTFPVTFRAAETAHADRYDQETYTLTVNEVNQAPVISAVDGPSSVNEESSVTLTVQATDGDQPVNTLTYSVTYTGTAPSGAAINASTGVWTWSSAVVGTYHMTFRVTDNGTPALNATRDFSLTVNEVDHEPEITSVTGIETINEGQTFHLTVNASDPDGDALTCSVEKGLPEGANISWNGCQFTWVTTEADDGTWVVIFRATENKNPAMFGEGLATLIVEEINEAPIINKIDGFLTVTEDETVNLSVDATDADTPGLMTYAVTGLPTGASFDTASGVLTWADPVVGTYPLTFTVHDNDPTGDLTASRSVTLQVTDLDHMPQITGITGETTVDEGGTITLTVTGTDVDGDPIVYSLFSGPSGATFNPTTHVFTWVTTEADNGSHDVVFRVTESAHANHYGQQTVTLTVNEINEPPTITRIDGPSAAKQATPVQLSVIASDADTPGLLTYAVSYTGTAPAGATFNTATGVWDWANPVTGEYHLTFTVDDNDPAGKLTASRDFTLTVSAYDLPVIDGITGTFTINEGQDLVATVAAHDPEGGTLSYDVSGLPAGASAGWSGNVFTWHTVESDGPGTLTLTFSVTANGDPARRRQQTQQVTINEVNRAPILDLSAFAALPDSPWVNEQTGMAFSAAATDPDLPANTLTFSLVGAPAGAAINSATGAFTWTPTHAQAGQDYTFTVRVADGGGLADTEEITIRVNALPAFTAPPAVINAVKDRPVQFTLAAADPDHLPGTLTYTLVSSLPTGAVYDPATRAFTWTPTGAQLGDFAITFSVTDGLATVQHTVTIRVIDGYMLFFPLAHGR